MIVLAIDSSTPVCGVALADEEKILAECFLNTGYTHSERLLPMIEQTLEQAGIKLSEIAGIAITKGPGSFTGLRIGMATAKGIAQVKGIKLIGLGTLDILAYNFMGFPGLICPLLNARKQEVYTAIYKMQGAELLRISEYQAVNPNILAQTLAESEESVMFLGDGISIYKDIFQEKLGNRAQFAPLYNQLTRAAIVAQIGLKELKKGLSDDLYSLEPFYLRKSEAEVKWEARQCRV